MRRCLLVVAVPVLACQSPGPDPFDSAGLDSGGTTATTGPSSSTTAPAGSTTTGSGGADVDSDSTSQGVLLDVGPPDTGDVPSSCLDALEAGSTVGCQFFAVDLDQALFFENEQYAVVVSNVLPAVSAEVVVEEKVGGAWVIVAGPVEVGPLDLHTFPLPNKVQTGSGIAVGGSYRITASSPIIAYQFNPLTMGYWSSDASMLYPTVAWDTLVDVVHWGPGDGKGYVTIVAAHDGTSVSVRPTVGTLGGGGVPGGVEGGVFMLSLDEGDVAQVAVTDANASLTGTRIEASEPIGVFTGHECAFVPGEVYACDHLEEQISGLRLWGTEFVAARMPPRRPTDPEGSLWQIYASEDGTTIELQAPAGVTGLPASPLQLDAGEVVEVMVAGTATAPGDFFIGADKPIAVFNYMTGWESLGQMVGDPAMLQLAPTEQQLSRYVVLVPSEWVTDFFVVARPEGSTVQLDGVAVADASFHPVAQGWEVARVPVEDGVHELSGSQPFSVSVVGYDSADSYAYLGGTGTGLINPEPAG